MRTSYTRDGVLWTFSSLRVQRQFTLVAHMEVTLQNIENNFKVTTSDRAMATIVVKKTTNPMNCHTLLHVSL